jgi:hypothetical protein
MSGFTEPRASGASERSDRQGVVFAWSACVARLPLVRRIAQDVIEAHEQLSRLRPEVDRLDRQRRTLAWPERSRRYQLQEEIASWKRTLAEFQAELEQLGLTLLDGPAGTIGFPTIVNDRRAYFSWEPGEEEIAFWNYQGESVRNPIPAHWTKPNRQRPRRRPQG